MRTPRSQHRCHRCRVKLIDRAAAALAEALEAVPPAGDWSKPDAIAWWAGFRTSQAAGTAATAAPTSTVTVDLGARAARPAQPRPRPR